MDILGLFDHHRSIRRFESKPLPWDRLHQIIEAAIRGTSSSGNLNSYSIILSRDSEAREKLWKIHLEQDFIKEAPCVMTFLADFHRTRLWLKQQNADDGFNDFLCFLVASFDAMLLSQSVALACEAEGWGICYMGTTLYAMTELKELFRLPATVAPVTSIVVGYPAERPEPRSRLPLAAYIHDESYCDYSDDSLKEHYASRNGDLEKRYGHNPELLATIHQHGVKNLAQFYTSQLKYFPPSMRDFGEKIKEYLKANDFDFRG